MTTKSALQKILKEPQTNIQELKRKLSTCQWESKQKKIIKGISTGKIMQYTPYSNNTQCQ